MDLVFSDHIRSLEPGDDSSAGFDAAWKKLKSELKRTIRRRGLWHLTPRYLGVEEASSWADPLALDDFATDCYIYAILDRLPSLKALLEVSGTVEGAVVCNIKYFVYDRQKKQDPVGYKIFDVTRCAIERLIEDQALFIRQGEPGQVDNETLVSSSPVRGSTESPVGDLRQQIEGWRGELFTDMVLGIRSRRARAEEELALAIAALSRAGVSVFRFKDLIDHIKARGRRHWGILQDQELGEFAPAGGSSDEMAPAVPLTLPRSLFDDQEAFCKLLECMARELARCPVSSRVRDEMQRLWELLKIHAAAGDRDRPPPQRRTAELLGIARGTLRKRQRQIRPLVEGCREGLSGRMEEEI